MQKSPFGKNYKIKSREKQPILERTLKLKVNTREPVLK